MGLIIVSGRQGNRGRILFVNIAMCMMLRRGKEQLIGIRLKEIVPIHLQENYELHWRTFYESGEAHFIE